MKDNCGSSRLSYKVGHRKKWLDSKVASWTFFSHSGHILSPQIRVWVASQINPVPPQSVRMRQSKQCKIGFFKAINLGWKKLFGNDATRVGVQRFICFCINFCSSNILSIGFWIISPGSLRKVPPKELPQININLKKFHSRWHVLCSWASVYSYDISLCSVQFFSKNIFLEF